MTSYFPARKPTSEEYNTCTRLEFTSPDPEWKPSDVCYSEEESRFLHNDGLLMEEKDRKLFVVDTHEEQRFISAVRRTILLGENECSVLSVATNETFSLSAEALSRMWGIGLLTAKKTIEVTTQRGVRTVAFPNVERRWPTGDRPLRYKRLGHSVYHDTLKAGEKSLRGNKCSEIYATDFGWSRNFPIKKESDVHETLNLFLSRYGIPEALISDGAKAYTGGAFKKVARQAGCHLKLTDPYSPWQNRAESEIREVKRLAGRWMVKTRSPRRFWDHCLDLASLV